MLEQKLDDLKNQQISQKIQQENSVQQKLGFFVERREIKSLKEFIDSQLNDKLGKIEYQELLDELERKKQQINVDLNQFKEENGKIYEMFKQLDLDICFRALKSDLSFTNKEIESIKQKLKFLEESFNLNIDEQNQWKSKENERVLQEFLNNQEFIKIQKSNVLQEVINILDKPIQNKLNMVNMRNFQKFQDEIEYKLEQKAEKQEIIQLNELKGNKIAQNYLKQSLENFQFRSLEIFKEISKFLRNGGIQENLKLNKEKNNYEILNRIQFEIENIQKLALLEQNQNQSTILERNLLDSSFQLLNYQQKSSQKSRPLTPIQIQSFQKEIYIKEKNLPQQHHTLDLDQSQNEKSPLIKKRNRSMYKFCQRNQQQIQEY